MESSEERRTKYKFWCPYLHDMCRGLARMMNERRVDMDSEQYSKEVSVIVKHVVQCPHYSEPDTFLRNGWAYTGTGEYEMTREVSNRQIQLLYAVQSKMVYLPGRNGGIKDSDLEKSFPGLFDGESLPHKQNVITEN